MAGQAWARARARREEDKSVPMVIKVSTLAAAARAMTSARSASKRSKSRWAWLSMMGLGARMAAMIAIGAGACTWGCEAAPTGGSSDCPARPICEQNTLVSCDEDGQPVRTECGADRCASDAPTPLCVPAYALPCAAGDPPQGCQNGRIIDCDPNALYALPRPCPSGELCVGEAEPRCVLIDSVGCDPDFWTPLCIDDERLRCTPQGAIEAVPARCLD